MLARLVVRLSPLASAGLAALVEFALAEAPGVRPGALPHQDIARARAIPERKGPRRALRDRSARTRPS